MDLAPETSLRLFEEGATLVFLDVPVGTEIGIDMSSWNAGEKFKGIKMIPPGIHFVYFSTVSADGHSQSPRIGFFHNFQRKELLLKKYDKMAEDLVATDPPEEDLALLKSNLRDLDKHLGPYPYDLWRQWVSLSSKLNDKTITDLSPPSGRICSAPELLLDKDNSSTAARAAIKNEPSSSTPLRMTKLEIAESMLPQMSESIESRIRYTPIPKLCYDPKIATAAEITKHNMDWTGKLDLVMEAAGGGPLQLLSELEFTFICFLVGQNFTSFEHWKDLIQLICYSDSAITKYTNFYIEFLSDLYFELGHVAADLFTDIVTQNNFIYACLKRLFENIRESDLVENRLKGKAERFSNFLLAKFGWEFAGSRSRLTDENDSNATSGAGTGAGDEEEEDDEDQPVIVDLETGNY